MPFRGTYMPKVSRFKISTVTDLTVGKHLFKVNNKDNRATSSNHRDSASIIEHKPVGHKN